MQVCWRVVNLSDLSKVIGGAELAAGLALLNCAVDDTVENLGLYCADNPLQDYRAIIAGEFHLTLLLSTGLRDERVLPVATDGWERLEVGPYTPGVGSTGGRDWQETAPPSMVSSGMRQSAAGVTEIPAHRPMCYAVACGIVCWVQV